MLAQEWREVAILVCVAGLWLILLNRLLLGMRAKRAGK
jgi:hypothetical protein